MAQDLEGDFWKDVFVHMQHKNMVRTNVERLDLTNAQTAFESFQKKFPDLSIEIKDNSSYYTWETFVTSTVKLRLFIQNQIKASLLKCENGDLVKIADAKFPYNPFEEIEELIRNKEKYEKSLSNLYEEKLHNDMQLKIAKEFAIALVQSKIDDKNCIWDISLSQQGLILKIKKGSQENQYNLLPESLPSQIEEIFR